MDPGSLITASLFVLLGLISAIHPVIAFNLRTWFGREVLDQKVQPGPRTLLAYRLVGIVFFQIGAVMLYTQLR